MIECRHGQEESQAVRWGGLELGLPGRAGCGVELQLTVRLGRVWDCLEKPSAAPALVMGCACWSAGQVLGSREGPGELGVCKLGREVQDGGAAVLGSFGVVLGRVSC